MVKKNIEKIFHDALSVLECLDYSFQIEYLGIGKVFQDNTIGSEISFDEKLLKINIDWFNYAMKNDIYDVYFILGHDARHVYQMKQIASLRSGDKYYENAELIFQWDYEMKHYVRNNDKTSQVIYLEQSIEIDANAFAPLFCYMRGFDSRVFRIATPATEQRMKKIASRYNLRFDG